MVTAAVEGMTDEAALIKLARVANLPLGTIYVTGGKPELLRRLPGFNSSAAYRPWLVLVDLDSDQCPVDLVRRTIGHPAEQMCFRVAVRSIEAWLLADRAGFARFMGVSEALLPVDPDTEADPKDLVVALARRSRRSQIRRDLVPEPSAGRSVGRGYTARIIEFAIDPDGWDVRAAAEHSDSLRRALTAAQQIAAIVET